MTFGLETSTFSTQVRLIVCLYPRLPIRQLKSICPSLIVRVCNLNKKSENAADLIESLNIAEKFFELGWGGKVYRLKTADKSWRARSTGLICRWSFCFKISRKNKNHHAWNKHKCHISITFSTFLLDLHHLVALSSSSATAPDSRTSRSNLLILGNRSEFGSNLHAVWM